MRRAHPLEFRGKCEVCPRECSGFGWFDPALKGKARIHRCCSVECADILQERKGDMKDATPHEIDAMTDAAIHGGKYLDKLKKSDLATLSRDEWMMFVETICTGFVDGMRLRAGLTLAKAN